MIVINIIEDGRFGGPQAWVASVAERLSKYGIETTVVLPEKNSNSFLEKLNQKGIRTRQFSLHRLTKQRTHLIRYCIFFISETISLYKLIKNEDVDIVHCNNSWQIKGVLASKLAGKPMIWTIHETQTPFYINIVFKFLGLHFCNVFITAGERVKNYYLNDKGFSEKQVMVIQAPVDTSVFDPQKVKEDPQIAQCKGIKIVTVGNLSRIKGIAHFIKMASILNSQHSDLNFFVIGSHFDNQRKYLEKMVAMVRNLKLKNLHFYGPSDDVPSILKAVDIYVCSSIAEASPISVWEAMSMAKPIVSTDVGDVAKFIKNGENGYVVPTKDSTALAEKVSMLIENKDLREKFGQQAREIAIKHLDIEICAKKHAQLYREIMNG